MSFSRRTLLKASAASAVLGGLSAPHVARAQSAEFTYKYANNLPDTHPMNARAKEMAAAIKAETNGRFDLHWVDPFGGETEEQVGEDKIVAPLPGTVVALLAEEGAKLEKGAAILTLEVMKMEQTLRAPFAGVLKLIKCKVGDIVQEGVELAEVEPIAS